MHRPHLVDQHHQHSDEQATEHVAPEGRPRSDRQQHPNRVPRQRAETPAQRDHQQHRAVRADQLTALLRDVHVHVGIDGFLAIGLGCHAASRFRTGSGRAGTVGGSQPRFSVPDR